MTDSDTRPNLSSRRGRRPATLLFSLSNLSFVSRALVARIRVHHYPQGPTAALTLPYPLRFTSSQYTLLTRIFTTLFIPARWRNGLANACQGSG